MLKFNKGDLVEVNNIIKTEYKGREKVLVSHPQKFIGIVVGYSKVAIGTYYSAGKDYYSDPAYLSIKKWYRIVKVIPLHTNQYIKPYSCFEHDLKIVPGILI